jgi:hypothetical protein
MIDVIGAHFERAAKAWVAAVLPILVGLIAGITGASDIDLRAWAGILGLATVQWVGVYFKANYDKSEEV